MNVINVEIRWEAATTPPRYAVWSSHANVYGPIRVRIVSLSAALQTLWSSNSSHPRLGIGRQTKPLRGRSPELADLSKENRPIAITDRATGFPCPPSKLGQLIITSEARLRRKFERNLWTVNYGLTVAVRFFDTTKMIFIPNDFTVPDIGIKWANIDSSIKK